MIKIKFKSLSNMDKEGELVYLLHYNQTIRQISTPFKLSASEWDARSETVVMPLSDSKRAENLAIIREGIDWDIQRIKKILAGFQGDLGRHSIDEIVSIFHQNTKNCSFKKFCQESIKQLERMNKMRTAETYRSALNSFLLFRKGIDVPLDGISADLMLYYESWLKKRNVTMNTVSFYMRVLRAVYNRAVEKGLTEQNRPFRYVYTGIGKTMKRAVSLEILKEIKSLEFGKKTSQEFSRDLFLFSFYTRGMAFVDMAYLKKADLKGNILVYIRQKTGQKLSIRWEPCMQAIVEKYSDAQSPYLLPIIREKGNERMQYRTVLHRVNYHLKEISKRLSLATHVTMYVARHSWASLALRKNIPISVISEGMGHDSENTTRIYLASIDHSVIDKANKKIIESL